MYWKIINDEVVRYATSIELLESEDGEFFENEIYAQRFLPKYVYEGKDHTMICVDTHVDGNKFLQIFDNEFKTK